VDEAHGAHLPFMDKNMSAIYNGADVVIQSLHKTLASLTQTAILHVTDKAVTKNLHIREDMRRYLSFMMSSSPSYILLASMELAVTDAAKNAGMDISNNAVKDEITGHIIDGNSEDIHNETEKFETNVNQSYIDGIVCGRKNGFDKYTERIKNFRIKCEKLENLRVFAGGEGYDIDITRIVIYQKYISGPELEKMLAEENIVVEMSGLDYVVLISSYVDNEADFVDLYAALEKIDGEIGKKSEKFTMGECGNMSSAFDTESEQTKYSKNNCICLEKLKAGDIAPADFYVYPPGIPIIAKGELITIEALEEIRSLSATGKKIYIS
jgi:arginine/lysine/ornithine decarboxylase